MIRVVEFGKLKSGKSVQKYIIYNKKGESVELLDFGAAIHSVNVLDKDGNISDVVLGVEKAEDLEENSFEGITIGRCANRIGFGRCVLDGKEVQLECNMFGHFLHGASGNYGFQHFQGSIDETGNSVTFRYLDTGKGGFDCNVKAAITFSFDDESKLTIHYHMVPEGTTVISPTNHTYFNLSGGDVRDLGFQVCTDQVVNRAEFGLPCDGTHSAKNTPADFTTMKTIRQAMKSDRNGYFERKPERFDEFYVLPKEHKDYVAKLHDDITGRSVKVYTDMESLIIFNGIAEQTVKGKMGATYEGYCGFCMETQFVPNAVNCQGFQSPVFHKGQVYDSKTVYEFTVNDKS